MAFQQSESLKAQANAQKEKENHVVTNQNEEKTNYNNYH